MSLSHATIRRRLQVGTVGLGVAVAALSGAVLVDLGVLTGTTRSAVEATAAAYGTSSDVVFVTLHAPLVLGLLMGAVGSVYVSFFPLRADADTVQEALGPAVQFYAEAAILATVVGLGVPMAVVTGRGAEVSGTLALAFVAGLPLGVLALCGATVGNALAAWTDRRLFTLLGTVAPAVGIVLAYTAPTGPVWTASAGATFTALALLGGGWSMLGRDRAQSS
jgi:hypothetical protein